MLKHKKELKVGDFVQYNNQLALVIGGGDDVWTKIHLFESKLSLFSNDAYFHVVHVFMKQVDKEKLHEEYKKDVHLFDYREQTVYALAQDIETYGTSHGLIQDPSKEATQLAESWLNEWGLNHPREIKDVPVGTTFVYDGDEYIKGRNDIHWNKTKQQSAKDLNLETEDLQFV